MGSKKGIAIGTDTKPPVLFTGDYKKWRDRFLNFIERMKEGELIMESLMEGSTVFWRETPAILAENRAAQRMIKEKSRSTIEEKERAHTDVLCKSYMMQGLTNDIYTSIDSYKASGHSMWKQIEKMMMGFKVGTQLKITNCSTTYEEFKAKDGKCLDEVYERLTRLLNELTKNGISKTVIEINVKFLSNLQPEWKPYANNIRYNKSLSDIDIHEKNKVKSGKQVKVVIQTSESSSESSDNYDSDSEMNEIKQAMAMLTRAFQKKFQKKPHSHNQRFSSGSKYELKDKFGEQKKHDEKRYEKKYEKKPEENKKFVKGVADDNTKCYNCGKLRHFMVNCRKPVSRNTDYYKNKFLL
ncbi:uncharacterized protein LOC112502746 [Cynara cardunculus var. scolymus]|uniref:uncharacterized protein LOC112502746 n=1 Tax=Cynara cardunculus var. scolymus TaxID=59895 RepID=UPI000D62857A|nr:uncharacterized protein LOC112502746 [Cynara cardunculus var. scolymus]